MPALAVVLRVGKDCPEPELKLTLESLACQYFKDFEVIVVFDFIEDRLLKLLQIYLTEDKLRISKRPSDLDQLVRRRDGRFISFLNSGQVLYPNAFSNLITEMESGKCGVAVCGVSITESDAINGVIRTSRKVSNPNPCRNIIDLWTDSFCPIHAMMFDRTELEKEKILFPIKEQGVDDYQFILRASTRLKASFRLANRELACFRIVNSRSNLLAMPPMASHRSDYLELIGVLQRIKIRDILSDSVTISLNQSLSQTIALYLSNTVSSTELGKALYQTQVDYKKRAFLTYLGDKLKKRHRVIKNSEKILNSIPQNTQIDVLKGVADDLGDIHSYKLIAQSGLFDSRYYLQAYSDSWSNGVAPLRHYMVWGGLEGRTPSPAFDSINYTQANPDLSSGKMVPLAHYLETGAAEGRPMYPQQFEIETSLRHFVSKREKILLISHDGSRTGAPMVAYNLLLQLQKHYDVMMLFLGPGPLVEASKQAGALVLGPVNLREDSPNAIGLIYAIAKLARLRFAIVNSVASRIVIQPLVSLDIPAITLVHEFAADMRPIGVFSEVVQCSDSTVFSTTLAIDNMLEFHPELRSRYDEFPLISQGQCFIPKDVRKSTSSKPKKFAESVSDLFRPKGFSPNGVTVVGLGTVYYRKGVDIFLDCAFRIKKDFPDINMRLLWVGNYVPGDPYYQMFIEDQIKRAELTDSFQFISSLDSLDSVYKEADLFFLSSRLDPLPNVAIDALLRGVPTLVFDRTTGIADILRRHGLDEMCVAPYLDSAVMAKKIAALAASPRLRREIGRRSQVVASEMFSATRYGEQIIELAEEHVKRHLQRDQEIKEIALARCVNADFIFGQDGEKEMAAAYLRSSKLWDAKPFPGFHPGVYRLLNKPLKCDPLVHFLRAGRPAGPWLQTVITPDSITCDVSAIKEKIALHIHCFYPDMLKSLLDRLALNKAKIDLLISVPSESVFNEVQDRVTHYRNGTVIIKQVINKGRDIGPFLTTFLEDILQYNIIGHVHTKKSFHSDKDMIQRWVYALIENTLGGLFPMADKVLCAMNQDKELGMVFPEDPNCRPWGSSYEKGLELARKLKIPAPLPEINFPVGTMFWARVESLRPLFDLKLTWDDYPNEPVPRDGTLLHAIERIFPQVVSSTGKTIAVTHVPGVTRLR